MTTPEGQVSGAVGKRYWVLVAVVAIIGLSLLFSYDFTSGAFNANTWSNLISAVQVSTLVVVIAFFLWWARLRE